MLVERFYERVFADARLAAYFAGMDESRLYAHQTAFFAQALGGESAYDGLPMREAHAGRAITNRAFDRLTAHLRATVTEIALPEPLVQRVLQNIEALRPEIVEPHMAASSG